MVQRKKDYSYLKININANAVLATSKAIISVENKLNSLPKIGGSTCTKNGFTWT